MSTSSTQNKCPRCGLRVTVLTGYCPACGFEFSFPSNSASSPANSPRGASKSAHTTSEHHSTNRPSSGTSVPPARNPSGRSPVPLTNGEVGPDSPESALEKLAGWRRISGVVIAIDGPYMAKRESSWLGVMSKFLLVVLLIGPLIVAGFMASQIASFLSWGRPSIRRNGRGFASQFGQTMASSYLTSKLYGPQDGVSVRDVRVRDTERLEHLIRVQGDFVAGNFSVGDEIEAAGFDQHGTLLFRSGWNKRTRTKILVKVR